MSPTEYNEIKSLLLEIRTDVKTLTASARKELLTPAEVCAMLKIGRTTYQRYANGGLFEQVRLDKDRNGKVYVRRSELLRLIDEGRL